MGWEDNLSFHFIDDSEEITNDLNLINEDVKNKMLKLGFYEGETYVKEEYRIVSFLMYSNLTDDGFNRVIGVSNKYAYEFEEYDCGGTVLPENIYKHNLNLLMEEDLNELLESLTEKFK